MDKIKYVNGFLFSPDFKRIVLIRKNRPDFQIGKINGIGGKINLGESPAEAMKREFLEEAGLEINNWKHFLTLSNELWEVEFFFATSENYALASTQTDEGIEIHYTFNLYEIEIISNLKWIIPMAMDSNHIFTHTQSN